MCKLTPVVITRPFIKTTNGLLQPVSFTNVPKTNLAGWCGFAEATVVIDTMKKDPRNLTELENVLDLPGIIIKMRV